MIGGGGGIILGICLAGGHPKTALLVTGLCAYSWGALLVEAGSRLPALVRRIHYRRWEGRYYAFDGLQIRIEEAPAGEPWAWLDDVLQALELRRPGLRLGGLSSTEYRQPPGGPELVSRAGIERLARLAGGRSAARFALWFERQVWRPAKQRAAVYGDHGRS